MITSQLQNEELEPCVYVIIKPSKWSCFQFSGVSSIYFCEINRLEFQNTELFSVFWAFQWTAPVFGNTSWNNCAMDSYYNCKNTRRQGPSAMHWCSCALLMFPNFLRKPNLPCVTSLHLLDNVRFQVSFTELPKAKKLDFLSSNSSSDASWINDVISLPKACVPQF